MPTGYTAKVGENENYTFQEFALSCARAFGALITMRDDPMDAPIPKEFQPSSYYVEALQKAEQEVSDFTVPGFDKETYGQAKKDRLLSDLRDSLKKTDGRKQQISVNDFQG